MSTRVCLLPAIALGMSLNLAAVEPASPGKKDAAKSTESTKGGDITDPKDALADIPRDVLKDLRPGNRDAEEAKTKATAQVRKNVEGKAGKFTMVVSNLEKFQRKDTPDINRTRIRSSNAMVREGGATFRVYLNAVVADDAEKEKLSKVKEGGRVTVSGIITNGEITMPRKDIELHIDIMDAKIE